MTLNTDGFIFSIRCSSVFFLRTASIRFAVAAALLGNVWLVSGCSSEPGNADIEKALAVNSAQGTAQMKQISKGSSQVFLPQVHSARKLGCKSETAAAYIRDVKLDVTPPRGTRTRTTASLRLVHGSDGWSLSRSK